MRWLSKPKQIHPPSPLKDREGWAKKPCREELRKQTMYLCHVCMYMCVCGGGRSEEDFVGSRDRIQVARLVGSEPGMVVHAAIPASGSRGRRMEDGKFKVVLSCITRWNPAWTT